MQQQCDLSIAILDYIKEKHRPVTKTELEAFQYSNDLDSELQKLLEGNLIMQVELENEDPNLRIYWISAGEPPRSVADDLREQIEQVNHEITKLNQDESKIEDIGNYVDILHEYNDLKDTGQALLGQLATIEGVTTKEMYRRYKLKLED